MDESSGFRFALRSLSDSSSARVIPSEKTVPREELDGIAEELSRTFSAPVGLTARQGEDWLSWIGLESNVLPSVPRCRAALAAAPTSGAARVALIHPSSTEGGESQASWPQAVWMVFTVNLPSKSLGQYLAIIGFQPHSRQVSRCESESQNGTSSREISWGPACPEPALLAWGQVVASRFGPQGQEEAGGPAVPTGILPIFERLANQLKVSVPSRQFHLEACTWLVETLSLGAVAWIPEDPRMRITQVGRTELLERLALRQIVESLSEESQSHLVNRTRKEAEPNQYSYAVATADPQTRQGWLLAIVDHPSQRIDTETVGILQTTAALVSAHQSNSETYAELKDLMVAIFRSLTSAIDAKDPYTCGHSERVARFAERIGAHLGMTNIQRGDLYLMGLLHDIGKIGVDDRVLKKQDKLTREEYQQIQEHVVIGVKILRDLRSLKHLLPGVEGHHEAFDGSGYPKGLQGVKIPLAARILAVADSYDAMSSSRPYRKRLSSEKIDQIFCEGRGRQWDPEVVDALFAIKPDLNAIAARSRTPGLGGSIDRHVENAVFGQGNGVGFQRNAAFQAKGRGPFR